MARKSDAADVGERSGRPAPACRAPAAWVVGAPSDDIAGAACAALDLLSIGVAIVDPACRFVWANRYFHELLSDADGLMVIGGELRASTRGQTAVLARLISDAGHAAGAPGAAGGVTTLSRPSAGRPYHAAVRPLPPADTTADRHVGVFITDPQRDACLDAGHIAALFDLTQAESALAAHLAAGKRLDLAAAALGVATGTARTHLKHVFQKTGTGRQGELSRLLRSLLGKLRWALPGDGPPP